MSKNNFDFSHYYLYEELVDYLHQLKADYPSLINLEKNGVSYEGRDIWLAIITNQKTGKDLNKPGYWIDGNTHAGEVTGSAVALYIIYFFLSQYSENSSVTRLLDNYVVYILPRLAVDGAQKYLQTPYSLRSSPRLYPHVELQDGLYPEDVNGDGLILLMRIPDPCGAWKISQQDSRVMVRRELDEFEGTYYTLLPEGLINNYDGWDFQLSPPQEGIDFNRNYPHQWQSEAKQVGAGNYPFSEPETKSEADFWHQHPNINGFLTYHTFSGLLLRPYGTNPDSFFPAADLEIYQLIGEQGTLLTGYPCVSSYHDFRLNTEKVNSGVMDDYGYDHFGWFGFTVELWDAPTEAGIEKKELLKWLLRHPESDDLKLMAWNDKYLNGEGFVNWQSFNHPQLGLVEIGGWKIKQMWQNAPPNYLPEICQRQCQFALSHALMSPRLAVAKTAIIHQQQDIYLVKIQLENQGFLPTYTSQKALNNQIVKPIEVILVLPEDSESKIIQGQKCQKIGHLEGRANKAFDLIARGIDYRLSVEWVIQGKVGTDILVIARSQRAGTINIKLTLN